MKTLTPILFDVLKKPKIKTYLPIFVIILFSVLLRINIGKYPYTKDEASTLLYIKRGINTFSKEFILSTKRPPFQYHLAQIMHRAGFSLNNEFLIRLPYALAGTTTIIILYLYLLKITDNKTASLFGALIFAFNGLTVALGKIVQYQPFVMLFSSICLYLFYDYYQTKSLKSLLLGSISFTLGFMFHWDIVFIGPIILFYTFKKLNPSHLFLFILSALPLLILYVLPYFKLQQGALADGYLLDRLGLINLKIINDRIKDYNYIIKLYNPFLFSSFFIFSVIFGMLSLSKNRYEYIWYIFTIGIFFLFIKSPGTHVYNALFPLVAGFSISYAVLLNKLRIFRKLFILLPIIILAFMFYQSYLIFVDFSKEYPLQKENILGLFETAEYTSENSSRYMIGFPADRYFEEAQTILKEKFLDYDDYSFITNDNTKIAEFYLDLHEGDSDKMFIFAVKDPTNFVTDAKFKEYRNKKEVLKLKNAHGRTMNKVYTWYK